jgi:hypothetical protein
MEAVRKRKHSSKGVLPSVLIRLQNLWHDAAKVLTRTVEPLLMKMNVNPNQC